MMPAGWIGAGLGAVLAVSLLFTPAQSNDLPWAGKPDFTAREVSSMLHKAKSGERLDLSKRDLTYLDLAGLDFKGALLAGSNLYGADLTGANLKGAQLAGTRLDRAVLIRTDLSGSDLAGSTILRPTIYSDASSNLADAPRFPGANMARVRVQADLSGADFRGADLAGAHFDPFEARPGSGTLATAYRNIFKSCDFSGARLPDADLSHAVFMFARFTGADLRGAKLYRADLSMADFSGADLTGADLSYADLDGTILAGAKGLDQVKGLETAINLERARR